MVLPAPAILLLLIVCGTNKCIDVNDHDIILDVFWVIDLLSLEFKIGVCNVRDTSNMT